jgi:hypothetical protein
MWRGGVGVAYRLPAPSSAGASIASPCFRFHIPLIKPDVRISRFRLSEKGSPCRPRDQASKTAGCRRSSKMGIVVPGACGRELFRRKPPRKEKEAEHKKGDIFNEVRKGTFLKSFDTAQDQDLTSWGSIFIFSMHFVSLLTLFRPS